MTPSCPWCGKRTSVERLPKAVGSKEWECTDCDVVLSGTQVESFDSRFQRFVVPEIRHSRTPPPPTQEELPTDA